MIEGIEEWIHQVNSSHKKVRRSCSVLEEYFSGFYSPDFLKTAFFVVTDEIPKPDFPELREAGLGDFIDMNVGGITYNDTYYIKVEAANELRLHFHEDGISVLSSLSENIYNNSRHSDSLKCAGALRVRFYEALCSWPLLLNG